jgi:hypothetical protein
MYRIIKRIVHTVTTVTWLVRLEDPPHGEYTVEKEITFPASHSVTEEEITDSRKIAKNVRQPDQPTSDEGENHE